ADAENAGHRSVGGSQGRWRDARDSGAHSLLLASRGGSAARARQGRHRLLREGQPVAQGPVRRNRATAVVSRPSGRTLAHELSNQLGIVISYAELLLEEL